MLNDFKNFSLYTNYKEKKFALPISFIDEDLLIQIKNLAELRLFYSNLYIPEIIKSLSTFRPLYIEALKTMTPKKIEEMIKKLIDGEN